MPGQPGVRANRGEWTLARFRKYDLVWNRDHSLLQEFPRKPLFRAWRNDKARHMTFDFPELRTPKVWISGSTSRLKISRAIKQKRTCQYLQKRQTPSGGSGLRQKSAPRKAVGYKMSPCQSFCAEGTHWQHGPERTLFVPENFTVVRRATAERAA